MNMSTGVTLPLDGVGSASGSSAAAVTTPGWEAAFTAIFVVTLTLFVSSSAMMVARRHTHPIRGHSLGLVFNAIIPTTAYCLFISAYYMGFGVQCWVSGVFVYSATMWSCAASVTRAWRIYVFYALANEKLSKAAASSGAAASLQLKPQVSSTSSSALSADSEAAGAEHKQLPQCRGGLQRYQHLFTERNFVAFAMVAASFAAVVAFIPYLTENDISGDLSLDVDSEKCHVFSTSRSFLAILTGVSMVFLSVVVWKLWHIHDDFLIKKDLGLCLIYALPIIVSLFLPSALYFTEVTFAIISVSLNAFTFQIITWKVIQSYRLERRMRGKRRRRHRRRRKIFRSSTGSQGSAGSVHFKLCEVLDDPVTRKLFTEHLKREWSIENLLFYDTVCKFTRMCEASIEDGDHECGGGGHEFFADNMARTLMALEIYTEYIALSASSRVNLPSELYATVTTELSAALPGFDVEKYAAHPHTIDAENVFLMNAVVPSDIFQRASSEIFRLMEKDSLLRFTLTDLWNRFLETYERPPSPTALSSPTSASTVRRPKAPSGEGLEPSKLNSDTARTVTIAPTPIELDESPSTALTCHTAESSNVYFRPSPTESLEGLTASVHYNTPVSPASSGDDVVKDADSDFMVPMLGQNC